MFPDSTSRMSLVFTPSFSEITFMTVSLFRYNAFQDAVLFTSSKRRDKYFSPLYV